MIKVSVEFQTYWQVSSGRGAGYFMDSLIEKDQDGLPYVSGKTLKGLFKANVEKIEYWQTKQNVQTQALFGSITGEESRQETTPGVLGFSNLRLSPEEVQQLNQQPSLKAQLTRSISSTKIDHETGVAQNKSLRTFQVAKPLTLEGEISLMSKQHFTEQDVLDILSQAESFITHIGAKKSRGYGQVLVSVSRGEDK